MIILSANEVPSDLLEYFEPVNLLQKTDMLNVATEPYPGAHYATFPTKLVEPCVLAGTSGRGVCGACGSPWERVTESKLIPQYESRHGGYNARGNKNGMVDLSQNWKPGSKQVTTTGYRPTCACYHGPAYPEPVPAIVLDPFAGSGTVGQVCRQTGRRFIGIDLNPTYITENAMPRAEGQTSTKAIETLPLFAGLQGGG